MAHFELPGSDAPPVATRTVTCDMAFFVSEPAEVVLQVATSRSAGRIDVERFEVLSDGEPPESVAVLRDPKGAMMHIIGASVGQLTVNYHARIRVGGADSSRREDKATPDAGGSQPSDFERQVYLRPSRYCPNDHLVGFAVAEFGAGPAAGPRISAITDWIRQRIEYLPGSGTVHDSAEDTLLTGEGTCRDFAHLGIALCRATGIPARFTAVYAPGLFPMDFHAVFEALDEGRWRVHDPTGLAPRTSLVRIVTGRDAADAAFADIISGTAILERIEVTAIAEPSLPADDHVQIVELA